MTRRYWVASCTALILLIVLIVEGAPALGSSSQNSETDTAVAEFEMAVEAYTEMRQRLSANVPEIGKASDPERTQAIQRQLAELIRLERDGTPRGAVFAPATEAMFRGLMRRHLITPEGEAIHDDGNPETPDEEVSTPVALVVNAGYPVDAPLSTVPPRLLLELPRLPDGLEYRFVGDSLILRDTQANIIVDFLRGVSALESP